MFTTNACKKSKIKNYSFLYLAGFCLFLGGFLRGVFTLNSTLVGGTSADTTGEKQLVGVTGGSEAEESLADFSISCSLLLVCTVNGAVGLVNPSSGLGH